MGFMRFGLGALVVAWSVSSARAAFAQVPSSPSVTLANGVAHSIARSNSRNTTVLNLADCSKNDVLTFPLTLSGSSGLSLEAWAGNSCDDVALRLSTIQNMCWRLAARAASDGFVQLSAPVRSLLYGRTLAADQTRGFSDVPAHLDPTLACQATAGIYFGQAIRIYFMLVDSSSDVAGSLATWDATFKLTRPAAPDHVAAGIGQEALQIAFTYDSASADMTIDGYQLYCDPAPGGSHEGAGAAADPGLCQPSTLLVAGTDSSNVSEQRCGSAPKSANSALVRPLTAGVAYNVAVTAIDSYDNESLLSTVVCETPDVKVENNQKSSACAFSRRVQPLPWLVVLSLAGLLVARRQRCRIAATVAKS